MTDYILKPIAEGSDNAEWILGAGASKTAAVQLPHDDAVTHIVSPAIDNQEQSFLVASHPFVAVASVDVVVRWNHQGNSIRVYVKLGGAYTYSATQAPGGPAYANYAAVGIARPGGGAWTPADLLIVEVGVQVVNNLGFGGLCTTLYLVIDGVVGAGGGVFNIPG